MLALQQEAEERSRGQYLVRSSSPLTVLASSAAAAAFTSLSASRRWHQGHCRRLRQGPIIDLPDVSDGEDIGA
jgi:hypothetical protein